MNETVKLGLILLIISAVAAGLLGLSNNITAEKIAEADRIANDLAKQEVLPQAESFTLLDENEFQKIVQSEPDILEINGGYDENSNLVGYTIKAITIGYGGEIQFMIGISTDGHITGLQILSHSESPGLGQNAEKSYFTDSFKDKPVGSQLASAKEPSAENEVQALTSATITTNAIVNGVNAVLEVYNAQLAN